MFKLVSTLVIFLKYILYICTQP